MFFKKKSLKQKEMIANIKNKRWEKEKEILTIEQNIKKEKREIKDITKPKFPSWAKVLLVFLFINFTIIEIFTAWVTISSFSLAYAIGMMPDFTPLVTLIGAVIGQTLSYGFYSFKSKAENVAGGLVYEATMYGIRNDIEENNSDDAVG